MTGYLFEEWIKKPGSAFRAQHIMVLLGDNCPAHPHTEISLMSTWSFHHQIQYLLLKLWIRWFLVVLTLSCRRSLSYRNMSTDLLCKSMDWFLYDKDLRHEIVKAHAKEEFVVCTLKPWIKTRHFQKFLLDSQWKA